MKFTIEGREYEPWELSNEQLIGLINELPNGCEKRNALTEIMIGRFKSNLCAKSGETRDDVFAHFFSNYVNRCPNDFKRAAKAMGREHRYLQNEMFKVFMEYVKVLKEAYEEKQYDDRNEYAVKTANMILSFLDAEKWPY